MRHGFSWIVILSCFGALFLICYAPALFMDRQFGYRDAANYYYPLNKRVQAEWNAGRWPLWEPEENAGMPLLGNPTAAVLYPGKLVFAILPYAWAARTYVVVHSALAFLAMLILMRSWGTSLVWLGIERVIVCVLCSCVVSNCNIIYLIGAAWLPLGIHAVDRLAASGPAVVHSSSWRSSCRCRCSAASRRPPIFWELPASVMRLAWRGTARRSTNDRPGRAGTAPSRIAASFLVMASSCLPGGDQRWRWRIGFPKCTHPVSSLDPLRWAAWVPVCVNVAWALVAVGALVQWRRRGPLFPLGIMWLGLAGSAALSVALTAVQLFSGHRVYPADRPFQCTSGRGLSTTRSIHASWSSSSGRTFWARPSARMTTGARIVPTPGVTAEYMGAVALSGRTDHRAGIRVTHDQTRAPLARLDDCACRDQRARQVSAIIPAPSGCRAPCPSRPARRPASQLAARSGPPGHRRVDGDPHRTVDLNDSDGSAYWWLSTLLPGFRQFRYPAKLFTFTALALAALAGFGWDRLGAGRPRAPSRGLLVLLLLTGSALAVVVFRREPILASLRGLTSPSLFGPFEPLAAYRAIVVSLGQSLIVLALGFFLTRLARSHPRVAGPAAVVLLTADLAAANARYVLTAPQALFEAKSEVMEVIENAERADPSPGPFRIYRMWQWYPTRWYEIPSKDRIDEVLAWDRDTLYPKFGIDFGVAYTHTGGVGELADYERFFTSFPIKIGDRQAAAHLDVEPGEEVIYYPRRGFDMWNTRYMIVAYAANGWRDPPRAHASFLFQSRQVYPDPDRFKGLTGSAAAKEWVGARDFKVIRNLAAYPRSWIVHAARAAGPVANSPSDNPGDTTREILYAADPLWNRGRQRVYDPHLVAWLSRTDLAELRPHLSGQPPGPSENVQVSYPNPQQAVLEVTLESPGLVILADVFYAGWELTIDGTAARVYRVNGSMRGAAVSAGHHRLVYTFRPLLVRLGSLVSIAGFAALVVLGWACARSPLDPVLAGDESLNSDEKQMSL